jgi:hypothetical protein
MTRWLSSFPLRRYRQRGVANWHRTDIELPQAAWLLDFDQKGLIVG